MTRKAPLDEFRILTICHSRGEDGFNLNPLAWRNSTLAKRLESMRKRGLLTRRRFKLDYVVYYIPGKEPKS